MAKTLKQIQKKTGDWVVRNDGYWPHFEQMAALVEECGEVAKELHHLHGSQKKSFGQRLVRVGRTRRFVVCRGVPGQFQ